jgi:ribosomal protein S2
MRRSQFSRKPSLIIIPDVSNNEMIIRETNVLGIPVIGLVNSNCQNLIAYPIFANDQSVYSIHFFCHFLSSLITKEIVKTKHKFKNVSKKTIGMQFPQALKSMSQFYTRRAKVGLRKINFSDNKE